MELMLQGKTTLANELVTPLQKKGRHVIRSSIDGFHNPRHIRKRQGNNSPRGFYEDSFNLIAIAECVLIPLGPEGDLRYKSGQFDSMGYSYIALNYVTTGILVFLFRQISRLRYSGRWYATLTFLGHPIRLGKYTSSVTFRVRRYTWKQNFLMKKPMLFYSTMTLRTLK